MSGDTLLVQYDNDDLAERIRLRHAKEGDAGFDLYAVTDAPIVLDPGRFTQINHGLRVRVPDGFVGFLRPRSSTFFRRGLFIVEAVIDSGYTGPLYTMVWHPALEGNRSPVIIQPWERLSQLIVVPYFDGWIKTVTRMRPTARGETGFGSTGG